MPEIARFYGIIIKLFFGDHPPPHFHAVYGEFVALFDIQTLEMIEGDLPIRAEDGHRVGADSSSGTARHVEFARVPEGGAVAVTWL